MSAHDIPTPVKFGVRRDESVWLSFGEPLRGEHYQFDATCDGDFAARLVRVCNAHHGLVEALKPLSFCDPDSPPPGVAVEDWRAAVETARSRILSARAVSMSEVA